MNTNLERLRKHLSTALIVGIQNDLDTVEKIFLDELGSVPEEVEKAMITVIKALRALLD